MPFWLLFALLLLFFPPLFFFFLFLFGFVFPPALAFAFEFMFELDAISPSPSPSTALAALLLFFLFFFLFLFGLLLDLGGLSPVFASDDDCVVSLEPVVLRTGDLDFPFIFFLLFGFFLFSFEGLLLPPSAAPPLPPIPSIPLRAAVASLTCLSSGILK